MLEEAIASVMIALDDGSNRNSFRVIDIRSFDQIELEGGISMRPLPVDYVYYKTPSVFGNKLGNLDRSKTYLLYGQTGELSGGALAILGELGFMEVYNMLGGFDAWQAEGLPTIYIECEEDGE
jgi:rhodanese-related sulfurtransferase